MNDLFRNYSDERLEELVIACRDRIGALLVQHPAGSRSWLVSHEIAELKDERCIYNTELQARRSA